MSKNYPFWPRKENASISPYKPRPYRNTGPKNREPGKPGKNGNLGCRFSFIPGFGFPVFPASGGDFFTDFRQGKKNQGTGNSGRANFTPYSRDFRRFFEVRFFLANRDLSTTRKVLVPQFSMKKVHQKNESDPMAFRTDLKYSKEGRDGERKKWAPRGGGGWVALMAAALHALTFAVPQTSTSIALHETLSTPFAFPRSTASSALPWPPAAGGLRPPDPPV